MTAFESRVESALRTHGWVVFLLAITLAGTLVRHDGGVSQGPGVMAGVLAGIATIALLVRMERPELTVLVNAAAVTAYFAARYPDGPIYLSVFFSAYALSARRPVRSWSPYALVIVPMVTAIVVRWEHDKAATVSSVSMHSAWFTALVVAALAIGTAVRNRRETRREQAARTATEERLRMAQDLHDGVGHGLAVIAMQAGVALHVLDKPGTDTAKVRESLLAIRDTSRESLDALRAELSRMAGTEPAALAPAADLAELPALVDRVRSGGLHLTVSDHHGRLPDEISRAAFLVVQEALTNVLRHAGAGTAQVSLVREGGALVVTVQDDGRTSGPVTEGMGIGGMRDRAAQVGGSLDARRTPDGFLVRAVMPVADRAETSGRPA